MMDTREQLDALLAAFGERMNTSLELDEDNNCAFAVDGEVVVNVQYLPVPEMVLLWSTVGILPDDEKKGERARYLLEKQDFWQGSHGFTLGMESEERRLLCHDIRPATLLESPDILVAWIDTLVEVTRTIRYEISDRFPGQNDIAEEFEDDFDLEFDEEDKANADR